MKKIKVAINGFGRIGRVTARILLNKPNIELVAINDLANIKTLAHLFKYDSVHRTYQGSVAESKSGIIVDGNLINVYSEKEPEKLPWRDLEIDVVVESTGIFRTKNLARKHIVAGAKKVIISAPAKSNDVKTVVVGINDSIINMEDEVISNASCTTNCAAPMVKILDELCGIESGYITTVHSYTGDQRLHDAPHDDLRRSRAAAVSIVPTTTGAAKAITKIFPHLNNKIGGCGIRVPVPDGSLTDITCMVRHEASPETINSTFEQEANAGMKNIVQYISDPVVSIDIVGNPHSCIFDSKLTSVMGNMVKIVGWYDNEAGYSNRLADLIEKIS